MKPYLFRLLQLLLVFGLVWAHARACAYLLNPVQPFERTIALQHPSHSTRVISDGEADGLERTSVFVTMNDVRRVSPQTLVEVLVHPNGTAYYHYWMSGISFVGKDSFRPAMMEGIPDTAGVDRIYVDDLGRLQITYAKAWGDSILLLSLYTCITVGMIFAVLVLPVNSKFQRPRMASA